MESSWAAIRDQIEAAKSAVAAQRMFGLALLRGVVDASPAQNVFVSPLSVFLALNMAEEGAAAGTRAAMRKVLALPGNDPNPSVTALQKFLKTQASAGFKIANGLWVDQRFPLSPDFAKKCEATFDAHAASLPFTDPATAGQINEWVKSNTNGKIDNIVTPEAVAAAVLILTNAVYFAGNWKTPFFPSKTLDERFHKTGGDKTVAMMHQSGLTGGYRSGSGFEGAMLSYKGSSVYFYALLPEKGKSPKELLESLDPQKLVDAPTEFDLDLKLPRFSMDFSAGLSPYLKKMGMDAAFHEPPADFSPMGSNKLFISEVLHKTRLEVDEKGTVAAAATSVNMSITSFMPVERPIKTLVFDRPFVLLMGEEQTGALLFAGVIEDPA